MLFNCDKLAELLHTQDDSADPFIIVPEPDISKIRKSGAASVDLRLGRWFVSFRHGRAPSIGIDEASDETLNQEKLTKTTFVPFGKEFTLHPGNFVLGITLEWLRLPSDMGGYITGRSSFSRRGLIIETATGVHPGYSGCLTLEMTNVGEIPIAIHPGIEICQMFFHTAMKGGAIDASQFLGQRRPVLGRVKLDERAKKLMEEEK
ncbi:MAG: dCTP deaminase [Alphaproteobacteria bacterium]